VRKQKGGGKKTIKSFISNSANKGRGREGGRRRRGERAVVVVVV